MRKLITLTLFAAMALGVNAGDNALESYISNFNYAARKEMKIDSKKLIELLKNNKAQLIDIRFTEEYAVWNVKPSRNIPLNELPNRLAELDKGKVIVTACPHKDRAAIAMTYLRSKGITAKYLTDGLIGLAENLRGDNAKDFFKATQSK